MASQIITLVAVLLGALTSFAATSWSERTKFRQALATRWDERKLQAYIDYISCVKEASRLAGRAIRAREDDEDATEALAGMEAAEDRRSVLFEGLVLLGDPAAARAAMTVNTRLWEVLKSARGSTQPPVDHGQLVPAVVEALNMLHEVARADLSVGKVEL